MTRRIYCLLSAAFFGLLVSACGPEFTDQEANDECDRLRRDVLTCFDDAVFDQCVSCHTTCGRECSIRESCPLQFECDE